MIPTIKEVRWSFMIVALCGIGLTATICWGIVHKIAQSDAIVRVAASSADQVERLSAQLDQQAATARAQERTAQDQRTQLQQQNRLTRAQLHVLLDYLRAQGISVPPTILSPPPTKPEAATPKAPAAHSGTPPKPRPTPPPTAASPTPTTPTASTAPAPSSSPGPVCTLLPPLCP